jgi:hypothetical protein
MTALVVVAMIMGILLRTPSAFPKRERKLLLEVRRDLSFLFVNKGTSIVPNNRKELPAMLDDCVTLKVDTFFLRIFLVRGELCAEVAPWYAPSSWRYLHALPEINREEFRTLSEIAGALRPALADLGTRFSGDRYIGV